MPKTAISDRTLEDRAFPESESTGTEWIVDALRCDPNRLRDLETLSRVCERVIADLGLHVLGNPLKHQFPHPGGVTALYMLSESHLACHTYPEFAAATFNLYCCRARQPWDWAGNLQQSLGSAEVQIRQIQRASLKSRLRGES